MRRTVGTSGLLAGEWRRGSHAVVLDHPSEHVQSWEIGWVWPWHIRTVAHSLVEEAARRGQCRQWLFRLERSGWRATLITLDATALSNVGEIAVWRLSQCLPRYSGTRRRGRASMQVLEVTGGWRFAAYIGQHLVYSRYLDTTRCPDRAAAGDEARALARALSDQGVVSVVETRFLDGRRVAGYCRQHLARRWLWTGSLRRPADWPPPRQWRGRLLGLWLWALLFAGAQVALGQWGVPAPDTDGPQLAPPPSVKEAQRRLAGESKLARHTNSGYWAWLSLLSAAQSGAEGDTALRALGWSREDGRQTMHWRGRVEDEAAWRAYQQALPEAGFDRLWPGAKIDLRWERLNPVAVRRLNDRKDGEPVQWRATLEVRG